MKAHALSASTLSLALVGLAVACSPSDSPSEAGSVLTISPLSVAYGENVVLSVDGAGLVKATLFGGEVTATGTVTAAGGLQTSSEPGKSLQLRPDGQVVLRGADGDRPIPMKIAPDGAITMDGVAYAYSGTSLTLDKAKGPFRVKGLTDENRRLASLLIVSLVVGENGPDQP